MTQTAIAGNIHQTLDAHLNLRPEFTLHFVVPLNDLCDGTNVLICPGRHFRVLIDTSLAQDIPGPGNAYPEYISEAYDASFVSG
jgi:hypothetical protein